jgi:hypothetical protein
VIQLPQTGNLADEMVGGGAEQVGGNLVSSRAVTSRPSGTSRFSRS